MGFHGGLWGRENDRIIRILMFLWVSVGPIAGPMLGNLGSMLGHVGSFGGLYVRFHGGLWNEQFSTNRKLFG